MVQLPAGNMFVCVCWRADRHFEAENTLHRWGKQVSKCYSWPHEHTFTDTQWPIHQALWSLETPLSQPNAHRETHTQSMCCNTHKQLACHIRIEKSAASEEKVCCVVLVWHAKLHKMLCVCLQGRLNHRGVGLLWLIFTSYGFWTFGWIWFIRGCGWLLHFAKTWESMLLFNDA